MSALVCELLDFVDDVVDDLGSREEVVYAMRILQDGTGADRQLKVYRETGDLRAVMDYVVRETENGLNVS
jgi:carboxylate-amine ligase